MLKQEAFDISEIKADFARRGVEFDSNTVYILPEHVEGQVDVLNEYAPDIYKVLKANDIATILVKSEDHRYLALRDASIMLPLILGVPFAILANFITDWIKKRFKQDDRIRLQYVMKDGDAYKKITIECNAGELEKIVNDIRQI